VLEDALPGAGYAGVVRHGRFDRVVVFHAGRHPELRGRSVAAIAAERGADPFDTFLDLIVEEDDDIVGLFDYIEEKNIRALLQSPLAMISSDGLVMAPPHEQDDPSLYWPCSYGEYPGVLERYVRDEPVLRLEEAIRKMTSFPAQRFGLFDRGALRPGLKADLVVFELDRVRDRATNLYPHAFPFENIPHAAPEGIDVVLVNGVPVLDEGEITGELPGRVLKRS
jgi:N-acyl-D-aspartate/D-glutamate deacylase